MITAHSPHLNPEILAEADNQSYDQTHHNKRIFFCQFMIILDIVYRSYCVEASPLK